MCLDVVGKGNKERTIYLNESCIEAISRYIDVRPYSDKEKDMAVIAQCIGKILREKEQAIPEVKQKVKELTDAHPLY